MIIKKKQDCKYKNIEYASLGVRMIEFLKKTLGRICPFYAIIPLIGSFVLETTIYEGSKLFVQGRHHFDFTTDFDRGVPVISWFSLIYFGCYLFWIVNFILLTRISKEHFYQTVCAIYLSYIICAIIFIALPTTNVRPEVMGNSIGDILLRAIYAMDTPENLFPSIHCSVSWFCYIAVRGKKEIPKAYQIFSLVFAILVVISTQVTKQHYYVDIIGGIALAEFCCWIVKKKGLYKSFQGFFEKVNRKCHME
ncbi:phosphatase PAP2 family protein [Anaerosporobacter sp.]|uniref:phosphatase PAP2 family protein n=1 Tax=Anaerosporobacter sp. TaxID=1872529 RepID=UPI00286EE26A|nr:phosphatase PAP2 family protein [Anaerosporobacter sp.]